MAELPFDQGIIEKIAENRTDLLTSIFRFFTFLGSENGYILIVVGIFWLYRKSLAIRLALVILASSAINHVIKIIIRNPRPFVSDGTYEDKWAISGDMEETKEQFSTPSGHAMGSASFWGYLHQKIKSRTTLILMIVLVLLIGISRPYLGVHYVEDIVLGWIIGFLLIFGLFKVEDSIAQWWDNLSKTNKILIITVIPILTWLIAGFAFNFSVDGEPFATSGGLLTGLLLGYLLENDYVNFSPEFKSKGIAVIRYILGVVLVMATLLVLKVLFAKIEPDDFTFLGFLLRYIRYTSVGLVAAFVSPYLFVKMRLAGTNGINS